MREKILFRYLWIICEYFPSDKYSSYSYSWVLGFTNYFYSYSYRSWLCEFISISICGENNYSLITEMLQKHHMDGQKILSFNIFHWIYRQYIHQILVPNNFIGYVCIHLYILIYFIANIYIGVGWFRKHQKIEKNATVSLHAKISDMPFDQKFFWPPEVVVLQWPRQTNTQTDIAPLWLKIQKTKQKTI